MQDIATSFLSQRNIKTTLKYVYSALNGFAANLSEEELLSLQKDPEVALIEVNNTYEVPLPKPVQVSESQVTINAETVPPGIDIVLASAYRLFDANPNKTAWILDTGCDLDHPDLNVDVSRATSFVSGEPSAEDYNGHGTHVAGTVGAKRNGLGVVGVAPNARIVPVKVLNSQGGGSDATILAGLNYVKSNAQNIDVVNISIGSYVPNPSTVLDVAILDVVNSKQGIRFAIAAGNVKGNTQNFPMARIVHSNVSVVAAIDLQGNFATSFPVNPSQGSNYGTNTIASPGVDIYSTYLNGGYATLTGTSMAAPHIAGYYMMPAAKCNCPCDVGPPVIPGATPQAAPGCILTPAVLSPAQNYPYGGAAPIVQQVQVRIYRPY